MSEVRSDVPIIEVQDLTKQFSVRSRTGGFLAQRAALTAVDNVSLKIYSHETVALVGESGSGKSTLGRLILGLETPTSGTILFDGVPVTSLTGEDREEYRRNVQVVFQDTGSSLNPRRSIGSSIGLSLKYNLKMKPAQARERIAELLNQVGLDPRSFASRSPLQLSGGQRQRVSIARAMASNPRFIVADEAVSALDVSVRAQVLKVFKQMQVDTGVSYLFITHDLGVVRAISDRVVVLYLGQVVNEGPAAEVFDNPTHPYTRALLDAAPIPDPAVKGRDRIRLSGDIPSPISPPSGCRFHTRCPLAQPICAERQPELAPVEGRQGVRSACHFVELVPTLQHADGEVVSPVVEEQA